jgi:hypothetical protein
MKLCVLGGGYQEMCFKPAWNETYGSGLRATAMLSSLSDEIIFVSIYDPDSDLGKHVEYESKIRKFNIENISKLSDKISFSYLNPLSTPFCSYPIEKRLLDKTNIGEYNCENLLKYGILEGSVKTNSKKVVYDPQDPFNPRLFNADESTAEEIVYILNRTEATGLTGKQNVEDCATWLLDQNNVVCCIIKCDAQGAFVKTKQDSRWIPVYTTSKVWLIGSGDIFSASFYYHWVAAGKDFFDAAERASFFTAYFSENNTLNFKNLTIGGVINNFHPNQLVYKKTDSTEQVYLAGPFFNIQQFSFLNEVIQFLKNKQIRIFSPFHEIGVGQANYIAGEDIMAIKKSRIIFALLDDLDPGTIFEIGYARALDIPVIIYSEILSEKNETMFVGSGCEVHTDLSTAVYKLVWTIFSL